MKKIAKSSKFYYPLTEKTVNQRFKKIFGLLSRGQDVTFRVAKRFGGAMTLIRFMVSELDKLAKANKVKISTKTHKVVIIDTDDIADGNKLSYMLLFNQKLSEAGGGPLEDEGLSYSEILPVIMKKIKRILETHDIIIVIRGPGFLEFANYYMWAKLKKMKTALLENSERLRFLFVVYKEAPFQMGDERFGRISDYLSQNVIEYDSVSDEDVKYSIDRWEYLLDVEFTEKERRAIREISRGYPYLIKYACFALVNEPKGVNPEEYLQNNVLIRNVLSEIDERKAVEVNVVSGDIRIGGDSVVYLFTPMEYNVLMLMASSQGKLVSKDDIAEVMWPGESIESYSDWAISQLIKRLRKKLKSMGVSEKVIKTVHGRGYAMR